MAAEEQVPFGVKAGADPGAFGGMVEKPPDDSGPKACCMCGGTDCEEGEAVILANGKMLHWRCFKCCKCGSGKQPETMQLFNSKVERVLKGTYVCDACAKDESKVSAGPAPKLEKAKFNMGQGAYFGQGLRSDGGEVKFMIRLLAKGKCKIEQAPAGEADPAFSWCVEGDYTEIPNDGGKGSKSVSFVVESVVSGTFAAGGTPLELLVEAGESHPGLVCFGVKCSYQIGKPEHELTTMMRTLQVAKPVEAPVAAEPVWADTSTSFPLAQVQNDFKKLNLDPSKREMYLSDAEFETLFKVNKEAFAGQPKWKRDAKKKELKLF